MRMQYRFSFRNSFQFDYKELSTDIVCERKKRLAKSVKDTFPILEEEWIRRIGDRGEGGIFISGGFSL